MTNYSNNHLQNIECLRFFYYGYCTQLLLECKNKVWKPDYIILFVSDYYMKSTCLFNDNEWSFSTSEYKDSQPKKTNVNSKILSKWFEDNWKIYIMEIISNLKPPRFNPDKPVTICRWSGPVQIFHKINHPYQENILVIENINIPSPHLKTMFG